MAQGSTKNLRNKKIAYTHKDVMASALKMLCYTVCTSHDIVIISGSHFLVSRLFLVLPLALSRPYVFYLITVFTSSPNSLKLTTLQLLFVYSPCRWFFGATIELWLEQVTQENISVIIIIMYKYT